MARINDQIIEEIMNHFGRTGAKKRPRIRKFHAELLLTKYNREEHVLNKEELQRPAEYIKRIVKFSKGWLTFFDEEALEIQIDDSFFTTMQKWYKQYSTIDELDSDDLTLNEQGILIDSENDKITFDGRLIYSKFYKLISDEGESMNDPNSWDFNDKNILSYNRINFGHKNSPMFSSKLFLLKFYVLRKIDEVAFVTSRFVQCPNCNASYVVPAAKIDFQTSYSCENRIGDDKICKTRLKKFPVRRMIPTYIYEVAIEVEGKEGVEFKEFFLESFVELHPGFFTGMVFGRSEQKTNSFYFTCLTAKEEKSKIPFEIIENEKNEHNFFNIIDALVNHIKRVGFVIDEDKARLPLFVETLKKLTLVINKEINLDHSLYFGAPGIGKTFALTLLHHLFYSNSGFISGPRFTLPGLTGGQKEILYQDTAKKKNVPGLFSNLAFVFDEINNAQFLSDDKAVNLFKSVALAASGTSTTVGGKEFPRIALISGTANYDVNYLNHYENKIKKLYSQENKGYDQGIQEQQSFLFQMNDKVNDLPPDFDFYASLRSYGHEIPKSLKIAVLKVRDEPKNYLTNFPKPLMERFYWAILVHPKYDKAYLKQKNVEVLKHLKARKSQYSQRELISQLFIPEFDNYIRLWTEDTAKEFEKHDVEKQWSKQAQKFLADLANKYPEFFSMFSRISQVHVFALYALSLINRETELSFATKRIFERLISLSHNPIDIKDFHTPDFENFKYLGETAGEMLKLLKRYSGQDIRNFADYDNRPYVRQVLVKLQNSGKIKRIDDYHYEIDNTAKFEEVKNEDRKD